MVIAEEDHDHELFDRIGADPDLYGRWVLWNVKRTISTGACSIFDRGRRIPPPCASPNVTEKMAKKKKNIVLFCFFLLPPLAVDSFHCIFNSRNYKKVI